MPTYLRSTVISTTGITRTRSVASVAQLILAIGAEREHRVTDPQTLSATLCHRQYPRFINATYERNDAPDTSVFTG